ncbi:uncharacterized protein METZ01_LOCUS114558 [marine metagenome]|uniref:Uncharacterized protein n=1 Tax=marine metagenome TaxID=408172 RepID=A0A381XAF0_9ZZZZ
MIPTKQGLLHQSIVEMEHLKLENERLQHLTTVLIDHIWKSKDRKFPLQEIDKQMALFDDGGIDGRS